MLEGVYRRDGGEPEFVEVPGYANGYPCLSLRIYFAPRRDALKPSPGNARSTSP